MGSSISSCATTVEGLTLKRRNEAAASASSAWRSGSNSSTETCRSNRSCRAGRRFTRACRSGRHIPRMTAVCSRQNLLERRSEFVLTSNFLQTSTEHFEVVEVRELVPHALEPNCRVRGKSSLKSVAQSSPAMATSSPDPFDARAAAEQQHSQLSRIDPHLASL